MRAAFGGILSHLIPWIHDVLSSGRIDPLLWPWKMLRDGGALFAPPSAAKPSNAMIRIARKRLSECLSPVSWKALWRFRVILTVAAFALAGCNANQAINPSGQADRCANDTDCNPYNPVSYAQTNTGIGR